MIRLGGLRPRVTLLVTAVVAMSLLIAFAALYRGTASQLSSRTDQDLKSDMARLRAAVLPARDADGVLARAREYVRREPFRATARLLFVAEEGRPPVTNQPTILDPDGDADRDAAGAPAEREAAEAAREFLAAPIGFSRPSVPEAGEVRVLVSEANVAGRPVRIGVGSSVEPNVRARTVLLGAFLLAGTLGLLGALVGGLFVASRVARPLRSMAGVATEVDEGELGLRMGEVRASDEVRVLAHAFDGMLDRLEDAFDRQGAFVADASHELRTPLTVVRGQLEVLAMDDHPPVEEVRRVERLVLTEIDRMDRLVEDLLVLARAGEPGFLRPEPIDLRAFLGDVIDGLARTADRRLECDSVPDVVIDADPDRIAQALRNLLGNAIAHTEHGGHVGLSCRIDERHVWLVVDDDGPGIPREQRQRVFDRFHRLDAGRGGEGSGAGLGLPIAQAIAGAHGGWIEIADSPAGGARVSLVLPLAPAAVTRRRQR